MYFLLSGSSEPKSIVFGQKRWLIFSDSSKIFTKIFLMQNLGRQERRNEFLLLIACIKFAPKVKTKKRNPEINSVFKRVTSLLLNYLFRLNCSKTGAPDPPVILSRYDDGRGDKYTLEWREADNNGGSQVSKFLIHYSQVRTS